MRFSVLAVILAGLVAIAGTSVSAADRLNGRYIGIDEGAGASINITPDANGYSGTFFDPQGNSQNFKADAVDDAAEAVLDMDQRTILLRLAPLPFGAQVSIIPFDEAGNLVLENSRRGTFLTSTGDYRFLAGSVDVIGLRLSCFDGV